MNIKGLLIEQFKDVLSEESIEQICEAFETAVEEKSAERIAIAESVLKEKIDTDHTAKLKKLVEKIDENHTAKLKALIEAVDMDHAVKLDKVVEAIDAKYTAMLEQVVEKYEKELNEKADSVKESMITRVSDFMDLYIDEAVPANQISEAVENIHARRLIEQVKKIVGIDESYIDGEVKEALQDGKARIDSLREELNEALKKNLVLEQESNRAKARLVLIEKTEGMSSSKKDFVTRFLKNKNPDYIEENFEFVVEMFERENVERENSAREEARREINFKDHSDRPELVEEQQNFSNEIEHDSPAKGVTAYLTEMQKQSKRKVS